MPLETFDYRIIQEKFIAGRILPLEAFFVLHPARDNDTFLENLLTPEPQKETQLHLQYINLALFYRSLFFRLMSYHQAILEKSHVQKDWSFDPSDLHQLFALQKAIYEKSQHDAASPGLREIFFIGLPLFRYLTALYQDQLSPYLDTLHGYIPETADAHKAIETTLLPKEAPCHTSFSEQASPSLFKHHFLCFGTIYNEIFEPSQEPSPYLELHLHCLEDAVAVLDRTKGTSCEGTNAYHTHAQLLHYATFWVRTLGLKTDHFKLQLSDFETTSSREKKGCPPPSSAETRPKGKRKPKRNTAPSAAAPSPRKRAAGPTSGPDRKKRKIDPAPYVRLWVPLLNLLGETKDMQKKSFNLLTDCETDPNSTHDFVNLFLKKYPTEVQTQAVIDLLVVLVCFIQPRLPSNPKDKHLLPLYQSILNVFESHNVKKLSEQLQGNVNTTLVFTWLPKNTNGSISLDDSLLSELLTRVILLPFSVTETPATALQRMLKSPAARSHRMAFWETGDPQNGAAGSDAPSSTDLVPSTPPPFPFNPSM